MIQYWAQNNARRGTSFSPTSIPNLALWLDAADASSITLDGSNNVSEWRDKSGNGRHATQATALARPTYAANSWNGLNAVVFDGVDDHLVSAAFSFGNYTVISVVSRNWSVNAYRGWFGYNYQGLAGRGSIQAQVAAQDWLAGELGLFGNGFNAVQNPRAVGSRPAVSDNTPVCISGRLGSSSSMRISGASNLRTSANGTVTPSSSPLLVGSTNVSTDLWNGRVCEFVLYDRELSDAEIVQVESYMRTKWGTP